MTYYINPIWFYLMNVGDTLKDFLLVVGIITIFVAVSLCIIWCNESDIILSNMNDEEKTTLKLFKKIIIASIIAIVIGIFVPSKETCVEMIIASQVTHENVSATKEEIYEFIDYITEKVNGEEE